MTETVLITGASSGIGKSLALTMAAEGITVIAVARSESKLRELSDTFSNIYIKACDLSDEASVHVLFKELAESFDSIDRLVLNAGTCEYLDVNEAAWLKLYRNVFSVNVEATLSVVEQSLPLLKRADTPHIVCIASMVTLYPFVRAEIYGASKAAIDYMMAAFRVDLAPYHIKVSTIYPGFVKTPLTDRNDFEMPFLLSADEAAERIFSAIKKGKKTYYFPKRLFLMLKLLSFLEFLGVRPKALKHQQ